MYGKINFMMVQADCNSVTALLHGFIIITSVFCVINKASVKSRTTVKSYCSQLLVPKT